MRMFSMLIALAALLMLSTGVAAAQDGGQSLSADLAPLNESGASGTATVTVDGQQVTVEITSSGVSASLPHAQHLHIGGENTCPDPSADGDGDGLISTAEGQPAYGEVRVSLTTEGEAGAESALAVDRFPVAGEDGSLTYSRTLDLPEGVAAEDLQNAVVVQHGIASLSGDETMYDGDAPSSLDPSLPLEATIPTTCGKLMAAEGAAAGAGTEEPAGATEAPTAEPTEEPAGATEAPTAEPTEEPAGATEAPTAEPTEAAAAPTEQPSPAPDQVEQMPAAAPAAGFGGTAGDGSTPILIAVAFGLIGGLVTFTTLQVRSRKGTSSS